MTQCLEAICLNCERRQRPCVKACACGVDGKDIAGHVAAGDCPLGKFAGAEQVAAQTRRGGPGTELARLLEWWGVKAEASCTCKARAAQMDRAGVEWCETNIESIADWLAEEAKRRGILFLRVAAIGLIHLAIRKAHRAGN